MNILSMIINFILVVMGLGGFLWMVVGMPVGIVWIVIFSANQDKRKIFPTRNWLWTTMGGMGSLLLAFFVYVLLTFVSATLGLNLLQLP